MRLFSRLFLVSLFVANASSAFGQLCPGVADPCVISTSQTVASGTLLDIGTRDLVFASGVTITVSGLGTLTIKADDVTFAANAKILADGMEGFGGDILIDAMGAVTLDPGSRIDVQAAFGGSISVTADSAQMNGQLKASATTRDGDGGLIDITTTFDTTIGGLGIQANGGDRFSSGGLVDVIAGQHILIDAPIFVKGGDGDGGDIDLDAAGDVTTTVNGELNSIATLVFGSGGATTITGGGSVTIGGLIFSRGQGNYLEGGGDGGDLDIIADNGDVVINGRVELDGSAPDGSGGFMDLFATGTIFMNDDVTMTGGREGGGGDLLLTANDVMVDGSVDLRAGFIGGAVDVFADGDVIFTPNADLDASTDNSGAFGMFGGLMSVLGCNVEVQAGARLLTVGLGATPRATIRMRASGPFTIAGTIQAGALVELQVRDSLPVFVPGSVVDPSPSIIVNGDLPCCIGCPTTTTSTSTSTSSTTSTSLPTTTTTSLPTTTTTSLPTTTTTSLPTTTTTSLPTTTSTSVSTTSSTTTTSIPGTTTSTLFPQTTTTTFVEPSTTTTTLPLSCLDEALEGLDAIACPISLVQDDLAIVSDDELGGRPARGLRKRIDKAAEFVEKARIQTKPKRVLRFVKKTGRKIRSFDRKLEKLTGKGKIQAEISAPLRARAAVVQARIAGLQAP